MNDNPQTTMIYLKIMLYRVFNLKFNNFEKITILTRNVINMKIAYIMKIEAEGNPFHSAKYDIGRIKSKSVPLIISCNLIFPFA